MPVLLVLGEHSEDSKSSIPSKLLRSAKEANDFIGSQQKRNLRKRSASREWGEMFENEEQEEREDVRGENWGRPSGGWGRPSGGWGRPDDSWRLPSGGWRHPGGGRRYPSGRWGRRGEEWEENEG
ncbi:uncharacterized protein LOC121367630 isoform X2 [Gigantopelta aegis]|uniref:uncharacterized protein LOC121367630 isoform X2 n=1 Tax=Gigantopelta aegis TaxID=1735272 RepID=UPI001B88969B|nr:uncharacterized protein LOC121367630 isoform X2 [Gigantopelta aegis]